MANVIDSFVAALLFVVLPQSAMAEEVADAPKADNELSFNLGATSDYRYRGISQSNLHPAIQGGLDYTNNPTGLYAGTWLSLINWGNDVGVLGYVYPGNNLSQVDGFANAYPLAYVTPDEKFTGKTSLVLSAAKTF